MAKKRKLNAFAMATLSPTAQQMRANGLLNSKNELLLYGIIGDWWEGLDALTIVREMDAMEGDTIVVRINSRGGNVTEGIALYNSLVASEKPVHVYVDGMCASIATVIAMAADKGHLYTPANALWMMHKAHAVVQGHDDQLRDYADAMTTINETMVTSYTASGRVSEKRVREILALNKDFYMTGAEAVSEGFADNATPALQAAAQIDVTGMPVPEGKYKQLFEFYAVNAAPTTPTTEDLSMKLKQLLALQAALTIQGIAAADINSALAKAFGVTTDQVAALLVEGTAATDKQLQAGLDALGALKTPAAPAAAPAVPAAPAAAAAVGDPQAAVAAIANERRRVADINALAAVHGLPNDRRDQLINDGSTLEQARAVALEILAVQDRGRQPVPGVRMIDTAGESFRASMANAMLNRMQPGHFKLEEGGRDFRGMSLLDMAAACLERGGINTRGLTRNELAAKALHSTSDFPHIVADVANKVLLRAYQAQPRTFLPVATQANLSDFKLKHAIEIGGGSELKEVNEAGEFEHGTVTEGKNSYKLSTFGRIFSMTRQLLINDDIGAFTQFMANIGALAARKESSVVWSLVKTGAIFSSGNKNLVSGGGTVDETQLDKVRMLHRKQVGLDAEPINVSGKYLVVNSDRETVAQKLLSAVLAASTSNVNPFAGSYQLIVEPLLDGVANNPWYSFADPALVPTLEYAYLEGEAGPYIETKNGFEVDGIQIKVRHDFGAGWVSHRGAVKNPGA